MMKGKTEAQNGDGIMETEEGIEGVTEITTTMSTLEAQKER